MTKKILTIIFSLALLFIIIISGFSPLNTHITQKEAVDKNQESNQTVKSIDQNEYLGDSFESPGIHQLSYFGGIGSEEATSMQIVSNGFLYVYGHSTSVDYPGINTTKFGNLGVLDIILLKYNITNHQIIWCIQIGGSSTDFATDLKICNDSIFLVGMTASADFPLTNDSYQKEKNTEFDSFLVQIDSTKLEIIYSTFIGGLKADQLCDVELDGLGNLFLVGYTHSNDFPVTSDAQQSEMKGLGDGIIIKMNLTTHGIIYSTFFGGSDYDYFNKMLVHEGSAFLLGSTYSSDFPVTPDAYQNTYKGGYGDLVLMKMNISNLSIQYSTYIGGEGEDSPTSFLINKSGNLIICGTTKSTNFPTVASSQDRTLNGIVDIFLMYMDKNGSLVYSTYVGGSNIEYPLAMESDMDDNVILSGGTNSNNFPITDRAYQYNLVNPSDAYIIKFDSEYKINYSTYFGGTGTDDATCLIINDNNNVIVCGQTSSTNLPTTNDAFQSRYGGGNLDIFFLEMSLLPAIKPDKPIELYSMPGDSIVSLTWNGPNYDGGSRIEGYNVYRSNTENGSYSKITSTTFNNYTDIKLINGVTYYYKVSSYNNIGESNLTDSISDIPYGLPSFPTDVKINTGNSNANISWQKTSTDGGRLILFYSVYRSMSSSTGYSLMNKSTNYFYLDTEIINGQTYYYKISASNIAGESLSSVPVECKPLWHCSPPLDFQAVPGNGQVSLTWSYPSDNGGAVIDYYMVYQDGNDVAHPTDSYFIVTGLNNGQSYEYKIVAHNKVGPGDYSSPLSATPNGPGLIPPGTPTSLDANVGDKLIVLTWQKPAESGSATITGYKLYRGTSSGSITLIATVIGTSYTDGDVTNGQEYIYQVSAVSSAGESELTEKVMATPKASGSDAGGDMTIILVLLAIVVGLGVLGGVWYMKRKKL